MKESECAPELCKSALQLGAVDRSRAIPVEMPEDILPVLIFVISYNRKTKKTFIYLDIFPETSEFVETDSSTAIGILFHGSSVKRGHTISKEMHIRICS